MVFRFIREYSIDWHGNAFVKQQEQPAESDADEDEYEADGKEAHQGDDDDAYEPGSKRKAEEAGENIDKRDGEAAKAATTTKKAKVA